MNLLVCNRLLRPILYTIFSLSAVLAQAEGNICYSTVTRSVKGGVFNDGVALSETPRDRRHELALQASSLIYDLADLDVSPSGADLLQKHAAFCSVLQCFAPGTRYRRKSQGRKPQRSRGVAIYWQYGDGIFAR